MQSPYAKRRIQARRSRRASADVVQSISDRVHAVADQVGASEPAFTDLATATDELAALALIAMQAIDGSLARASHRGVSSMLAAPQHELAISWTVRLEKALDAAGAPFGRGACPRRSPPGRGWLSVRMLPPSG
jgi:hypothetical protein